MPYRRLENFVVEDEKLFFKVFKTNPCIMSISEINSGMYYRVNDAFLTALGYDLEERRKYWIRSCNFLQYR
ncbi:hypothetical protein [Heliorestis acidaminivorans]|uniref:hypothetical protein n=1 Tax=Heliorestis acidaminivorans TaxID=553427 RepID=UPI001478379A|nr:hypothetical protein [Heliorestis acidaminivorans]